MANIRIPKDYTKKVFKSVHNRGTIRRTTAHAGLMFPVYSRRVMAGEKVMIEPTTVIQTNALLAPLFGSFTLQLAFFFDSDSNYYGWMDNNARLTTQELLSRMRHRCRLDKVISQAPYDLKYADWANAEKPMGVQRHSMLEYFGFPVGATPVAAESGEEPGLMNPEFDLGFFFTYLNIFRNYYCNNQEDKFPFVKSDLVIGGDPFETADLSILDKLFKELRFQDDGIDISTIVSGSQYPGIYWFLTEYLPSQAVQFGGLLPSTYRPDLMVNLLNKTNNVQSFVNIEDGKFSIDTLRFQNKLQRLIDRFDVSGGRFSNWLRAVWGVKTRKDMDIPELIGITQKLIDPTDLVNASSGITSADTADDGNHYLGDQGGNFNKIHNHRGHSFYASTSGRVMCIMTLVPNVDYSQGTDYECTKVSFADDYVPEFAQLGFQNVPLSRYSSLPVFVNDQVAVRDPYTETVGKEVAWLPEMTDVNRNFGQYAWNGFQSYWVLSRLYSRKYDLGTGGKSFIPNITQYINPLEYQYPFVAQSVDDPNWQIQVGFKVRAVRPIGKRFMPNLE